MTTSLLEQLIEAFRILPGVGQKTAQRMAYHVLEREREGGRRLAEALASAIERIGHCVRCRDFSETETCATCASASRDAHQLCAVESPADRLAIEQATGYRGLYFVLQGRLSPLDGIGPRELGLEQLATRLARGRGAGTDHRHQSDRGRRGDRALPRPARAPATACVRAGSRTACRWAANWNTWIAARCRMPSAAAARCRCRSVRDREHRRSRKRCGNPIRYHATADPTWNPRPSDTIFHKIIRREIPADIVYEDEHLIAFRDIAPQAPVHVLFVPKEPVATLNDLQAGRRRRSSAAWRSPPRATRRSRDSPRTAIASS